MARHHIQNEAFYSPEYEPNSSLLPHRRSNSGATTLLGSSEHSHHTEEPLLQYGDLVSTPYLDLSSHQAPDSGGPRPAWTASLALDGGDTVSLRERKYLQEHHLRTRLRRLKWSKHLLEALIAAFSVYTTVRYFLAFTIFESTEGQATSLALGICTGAVFGLTACATALEILYPYLVLHRVSSLLLSRTSVAFHATASLLLLASAAVNAALLFVWKNSPIRELNIQRRCHVDIDVIWSVSDAECKPPAWAIWIVLTFLRLAITIVIITLYSWISANYTQMRQPSFSQSWPSRHVQGAPSESYLPTHLPSMTAISPSLISPQSTTHHPHHMPSDSTLRSFTRSKHSSNHVSSPSVAAPSAYSEAGTDLDHQQVVNANPDNSQVALDDYHEHFRNLVSQITRETEEALELATNESSSTESDIPLTADYYSSRVVPTIGYDEFGRPYPADEHVPILNGFVRRMPTIESLGSREMASIASSLSHADTMTSIQSSLPISRPPTSGSTFGSRPPSRTNSISAGAEILLNGGKTSEVGELMVRYIGDARAASTASSNSSYPSTYYTATSYGSSSSSASPRPVTR